MKKWILLILALLLISWTAHAWMGAQMAGPVAAPAGGPDVWYYAGGHDAEGDFTNALGANDINIGSNVTVAQAGTVTQIKYAVGAFALANRIKVYDNANNLMACIDLATPATNQWNTVNLDVGDQFAVSANDVIEVHIISDGNTTFYYGSGTGGYYSDVPTYAGFCTDAKVTATLPEPFGVAVYVD